MYSVAIYVTQFQSITACGRKHFKKMKDVIPMQLNLAI